MIRKTIPISIAKYPGGASVAATTSWDDNDRLNLRVADALNSFGLRGTFYIDFGKTREDPLRESDVRRLAEGHEIGSHTWTHKNLKTCSIETIREELLVSKERLEAMTGRRILGLAYPWGESSELSRNLAMECGYLFGRTVEEGTVTFPPRDPYLWGITVHALEKPRFLSRRLPFYLYRRTSKWPKLATRLFDEARRRMGVWHLFGHAWEIFESPGLLDDFLAVCKIISDQQGVWHATNGMLFLNRTIKNSTRIRRDENETNSWHVNTVPPAAEIVRNIPMSFLLPIDESSIKITGAQTFDMGTTRGHTWVDIFEEEALISVVPP